MADNILRFDIDAKDKYKRANDRCDEGDYAAALSALVYEETIHPENIDVLCHIADIYTEIGMYENAVAYWFKFLSKAKSFDRADGYNGLGANYYFLGNYEIAGYYFNKQMETGDGGEYAYDDVMDDYFAEIGDYISKNKILLAEDEPDDELFYNQAVEANKQDKFLTAVGFANEISSKSEFYAKAQYQKAYGLFGMNEQDEAIDVLKKMIKKTPDDVEAVALLIAAYAADFDAENAEKYVEKLKTIQTDDVEKLNRIAAILFDHRMYDDALKYAEKVGRLKPEDPNAIYIRGLLKYNQGQFEQSETLLKTAYLYSRNPSLLYFLRIVERANAKDATVPKTLTFDEIKKASLERKGIIGDLFSRKKKLNEFDERFIYELIEWCFLSSEIDYQIALSVAIIYGGERKFIRKIKDQLLNPVVSDEVKSKIISIFCEKNIYKSVFVVYTNIFKNVKIIPPDFGSDVGICFTKAYAFAFGKISYCFDSESLKIFDGAKQLEATMRMNCGFEGFDDIYALAYAMYHYSGLNLFGSKTEAYEFFNVKSRAALKLLALSRGEEVKETKKKTKKKNEE